MSKYRSFGQAILFIGVAMLFTIGCSPSLKYMGKDVGMEDFEKDLTKLRVNHEELFDEKYASIIEQYILPLASSKKTAKYQENFQKCQNMIFLAKDSTCDINYTMSQNIYHNRSWDGFILMQMESLTAQKNSIQLVPFFVNVFKHTKYLNRHKYFLNAIQSIFWGGKNEYDYKDKYASWNERLPRFGSAAQQYTSYKDSVTDCLYECLSFLNHGSSYVSDSAKYLDMIYALDSTVNKTKRFIEVAKAIRASEDAQPTLSDKHSWGTITIDDLFKKVDDMQLSGILIDEIFKLDAYRGAPFLLSRMATFKNNGVENVGMLFEAYNQELPRMYDDPNISLGNMHLWCYGIRKENVLGNIVSMINDPKLKEALSKSTEDIIKIYEVQSDMVAKMIEKGRTDGVEIQNTYTMEPLARIMKALNIEVSANSKVAEATDLINKRKADCQKAYDEFCTKIGSENAPLLDAIQQIQNCLGQGNFNEDYRDLIRRDALDALNKDPNGILAKSIAIYTRVYDKGTSKQATTDLEELNAVAKGSKDEMYTVFFLGMIFYEKGFIPEAYQMYMKSVDLARQNKSKAWYSYATGAMSFVRRTFTDYHVQQLTDPELYYGKLWSSAN